MEDGLNLKCREREQAQREKDFEETNADRINVDLHGYYDQDYIVFTYPSKAEEAAELEKELYFIRQMRQQYKSGLP
jgi:hypothetical protein